MKYSSLLAVVLMLPVRDGAAQVIDSSATGFVVKNVIRISVPPERVYRALVAEVGSWWNPAHTFSGDARNVAMDARPGGCLCETLPGGGGAQHLTVIFVDPGKRLRLTGALGPLQESGLAGSMTWDFAAADGGTEVTLTYAVGGFRAGGLQQLASPVSSVLAGQLGRLKEYVEQRKP